jgi:succinate dehydrogenase (ubiquinone) cytochrome b560 subunit
MAKTRRPVSPHVTIYSFPICALSSITTRVTGCTLSFGAAGLGLVELFGGNGAALSLMSDIGSSSMLLSSGAKFAVAFPVVYHYFGGLRHLLWDNAPEMLTNVDVEKASYTLIGASVLVSGVALVA